MYNNISNHQNVNILYNSSFVILVTVQNELCSSMYIFHTTSLFIQTFMVYRLYYDGIDVGIAPRFNHIYLLTLSSLNDSANQTTNSTLYQCVSVFNAQWFYKF
eukprot:511241_1